MPHYEITLITRNLGKVRLVEPMNKTHSALQADLFTALKRAVTLFLDHGAVVRKLESGGHRDLPFRRVSKQTKEHVFTSK